MRVDTIAQSSIDRPGNSAVRGLARWELLTVGVWFVVFSVLAEFFPRTGDDWAWGDQEGVHRLDIFFQGINGRYAGDLAILGLTRSGPFAALIVSATVCATLVLVLQLGGNRTPLGYGAVSVLFLLMPLGTWREAVVWLSGFANYAFAALTLIVFLALMQAEWCGRLRAATAGRLVLVAIASFVGQMFMEHVTFCICIVGLAVSVAYRRRRGRWAPYSTTWTLAAFVGAAVVLANPAYRHVASGTQGYQKSELSGPHALRNLAVRLLDYLPTQAVVDNVYLNAALAACLVVVAVTGGRLRTIAGKAVLALTLGFVLLSYGLWIAERRHAHLPEHTRAFAAVATALLLAALLVAALTLIESRERAWAITLACGALIAMTLPLLVVNPIGPRVFYPTYILFLIVLSALLGEVRAAVPLLRHAVTSAPLHVASIGLMVALFVIYGTIHNALEQRLEHVRQAARAGATVVDITPLPYSYYVHNGDPFFSVLQHRFSAYYGLPKDMRIKLTPNPWLRVPGKPPPKKAP